MEKNYPGLERVVGYSVVQTPQGREIAEEIIHEKVEKIHETVENGFTLAEQVKGVTTTLAANVIAGTAVGYIANGEEGAVAGALYGTLINVTSQLFSQPLLYSSMKYVLSSEKIKELYINGISESILNQSRLLDYPVKEGSKQIGVMGIVGAFFTTAVSYPVDWIGAHLPYASEVVSKASEMGVSAFAIGALGGIFMGAMVQRKQYSAARESIAEIQKRFSEVKTE